MQRVCHPEGNCVEHGHAQHFSGLAKILMDTKPEAVPSVDKRWFLDRMNRIYKIFGGEAAAVTIQPPPQNPEGILCL